MTAGTGEHGEREFDYQEVEPKCQDRWEEADVFHIPDDAEDPAYVLAVSPSVRRAPPASSVLGARERTA